MRHASVQIVVGASLIALGLAFVVYGVRRLRGAHSYSTAPLARWDHYLNFGRAPRSWGSERRVERMAGTGMVLGGAFAVLVGITILGTGIGG